MLRKVVLFDDLARQFPNILLNLEQLGAEAVMVSQGREVLQKIKDSNASIAVLDVFMPGMSGIELCRQIKDSDSGGAFKVVLVSAENSDRIKQRALDYGCDLYLLKTETEAQLLEYFEKNLGKIQEENRRVSDRVEISGAIRFVHEGIERIGELMNASDTGVLFASSAPIPVGADISILFEGSDGNSFTLETKTVRAVELKQPVGDKAHAIGAKFVPGPIVDQQILDALLIYKEQKTFKMDSKTLRGILDVKIADLVRFLQGDGDPLRIRTYVGELSEGEREAFNTEGQVPEFVRRMVLFRAKCHAFFEFIPHFRESVKELAPVFVPLLKALLTDVESLENEIDQVARQAVAAGDAAMRKNLNEPSNRLHEYKLKLVFRVYELIPLEGMPAADRQVLEVIRKRAEEIRELERPPESILKYDRKKPPPTKKEEEEEEKGKGKEGGKGLKIAFIIVSALILGGIGFYNFMANRVPVSELQTPLAVEKITKDEFGLKLFTSKTNWEKLTEEDKQAVFGKIIEYCQSHRMPQALILDEENHKLGAITSGAVGRKRGYSSRDFTKKAQSGK